MAGEVYPVINAEFAGISDNAALHAEIDSLRADLADTSQQIALERQLADSVHLARVNVIVKSDTLQRVFKLVEKDGTESNNVASAFDTEVPDEHLPDGLKEAVAHDLRIASHPDRGVDEDVAKEVGGALLRIDTDGVYALAEAIVAAPSPKQDTDVAKLRVERYRLGLVKSALTPAFESAKEAHRLTKIEVEGAEWRVRVSAAFKSVELIIGSPEIWARFMQGMAAEGNPHIINNINRNWPQIQTLLERMHKGDPIKASKLDIPEIDAVFERIWSTLNKEDSLVPYHPPYNNWLEIILPALQKLDPGQKEGQEYTSFVPPILVQRESYVPKPPRPSYAKGFSFDLSQKEYFNTQETSNEFYSKKYKEGDDYYK